MKKSLIITIFAIILLTSMAFATTYNALTATFPIFINGTKWNTDKPVVVINGTTYLPLKAIGEALNVDINWNNSLNRVEINNNSQVTSKSDSAILFNQIYSDYKENELRADSKYKGNRYQIPCVVYSVNTGGLNGLSGNISVSAYAFTNSKQCVLFCSFDSKTQKEKLLNVNAGDKIIFEGTCSNWGNWSDCKIISIDKY